MPSHSFSRSRSSLRTTARRGFATSVRHPVRAWCCSGGTRTSSAFQDAFGVIAYGGLALVLSQVIGQLVGRRSDDGPLEELTPREREVLKLMAQGLSKRGICEKLVVSPKTVETHVSSIFGKLGLMPAPDEHRRVLAVLALLRS
jgi:Bacterial regulatory proteins, luxR family